MAVMPHCGRSVDAQEVGYAVVTVPSSLTWSTVPSHTAGSLVALPWVPTAIGYVWNPMKLPFICQNTNTLPYM